MPFAVKQSQGVFVTVVINHLSKKMCLQKKRAVIFFGIVTDRRSVLNIAVMGVLEPEAAATVM